MPGTQAPLRGFHVLVVDDDEDTRELFLMMLELHGARVSAVGRGGDALSACAAESVDVVLCDLVLPDMGGRVLADRLRRERPATGRILVTGHHVADHEEFHA